MVDTYGGLVPHGGGSFSGKDLSKVGRSGAYMARLAAKSVVAAGTVESCLVSVAYVFGCEQPVMIDVSLGDDNRRAKRQLMDTSLIRSTIGSKLLICEGPRRLM